MDDTQILARINELVNEENSLWEHEAHASAASDEDKARLAEIKVEQTPTQTIITAAIAPVADANIVVLPTADETDTHAAFLAKAVPTSGCELSNTPMMLRSSMVEGRVDLGTLASGQVAGVIDDLPSCEELIQRIMAEDTMSEMATS